MLLKRSWLEGRRLGMQLQEMRRPETGNQKRQRLVKTGLGVRETSAGPDGRKQSPEVVGLAMSFLAEARAVGPMEEEQPGQGRQHCE